MECTLGRLKVKKQKENKGREKTKSTPQKEQHSPHLAATDAFRCPQETISSRLSFLKSNKKSQTFYWSGKKIGESAKNIPNRHMGHQKNQLISSAKNRSFYHRFHLRSFVFVKQKSPNSVNSLKQKANTWQDSPLSEQTSCDLFRG